MSLKKYLPSLPQVTAETLAVLAAAIIAAWVISRWPAVRELVRDNSING